MPRSSFTVVKCAEETLESHGRDKFLARRLYFDLFQSNLNEWIQHSHLVMTEGDETRYLNAINQLLDDVPLEYITGYAHFYGRRFKVDKHTLIPRVETEELVYHVLNNENDSGLTVVDIGAGSGAIGLTLLKEWQTNKCILTDISSEALNVVQYNAKQLNVSPIICKGDLYQPLLERNIKVDVIVSNPPYISEEERHLMSPSTLKYEPKSALFAHDSGLFFYKKMIRQLPYVLKRGGRVYFEIGYQQGASIKHLINDCYPKTNVEVIQDINGHDRMIYFKWDD